MLRQLRKKKFKVFYFRAASKEADRDLVPLTARDGNDTLTLWATIAPPRNRVRQQRVLKGSSVLSLAPRTSIFEPQPVSIATCAEDGDKEQGVAKKAKTLARGVPTGCKVHIVPGDGSCVTMLLLRDLAGCMGLRSHLHMPGAQGWCGQPLAAA